MHLLILKELRNQVGDLLLKADPQDQGGESGNYTVVTSQAANQSC